MFAIVETGGKQFRVEEGRSLKVARMDAQAGSAITLDKILLVGAGADVKVGQPFVSGASVQCEVVDHGRDKKIIVFKKKRNMPLDDDMDDEFHLMADDDDVPF